MSLVEKALRKLQESTPRAPAPAGRLSPAVDVMVKTSDTGAHREPSASGQTPARTVAVNMAALRAAALLAPEYEQRQIAQQYRQIKRPLIDAAIGRGVPRIPNGHLIMVASAVPGEGKTFTAINLALSMSIEKDIHVLLVDADVAKPHISRLFGISDAPGLLDALRNPDADVERVILPTDVANLSVLPAGKHSPEATELLASAGMEKVLLAIGQHDQRRLVIFDSPPLLHTTESRALVQASGQVLVVVRADTTPQRTLQDALTYLGDHPAVSLVLNQSMQSAPEAYYHYGYGDSRPVARPEDDKK